MLDTMKSELRTLAHRRRRTNVRYVRASGLCNIFTRDKTHRAFLTSILI